MFEKRFRPFFRKTLVEQDGAFGRSAARDLDAAEAARRAGIGPQAVGNAFQGFPVPVQAGFEDGMTLAEIDPHRIAFGAGDSTETCNRNSRVMNFFISRMFTTESVFWRPAESR